MSYNEGMWEVSYYRSCKHFKRHRNNKLRKNAHAQRILRKLHHWLKFIALQIFKFDDLLLTVILMSLLCCCNLSTISVFYSTIFNLEKWTSLSLNFSLHFSCNASFCLYKAYYLQCNPHRVVLSAIYIYIYIYILVLMVVICTQKKNSSLRSQTDRRWRRAMAVVKFPASIVFSCRYPCGRGVCLRRTVTSFIKPRDVTPDIRRARGVRRHSFINKPLQIIYWREPLRLSSCPRLALKRAKRVTSKLH